MQELKRIQRINWQIDFFDYIEIFSRLFITVMTVYTFGQRTQINTNKILIPLGFFIMGILMIWSLKPLLSHMKSEEYYEETPKERKQKENKEDNLHGK